MKAAMVATRKTTRGFIVTTCNYDKYQTPGNYKRPANATTVAERTPQCAATINNNNKHKDIQAERERALSAFQRPSADSAPLRAGKSGMTIEIPVRFIAPYTNKIRSIKLEACPRENGDPKP